MHVLNVNHTLDPATGGGTAERTLQMSRFLACAGVECTVITGSSEINAGTTCTTANLTVVAVPFLSQRFFIPLVSGASLRKLVDKADIVHLMGHWSALNALAYRIARQLHKPYVVCPAGALPIYGRSRFLKRFYNLVVGNQIVRNADTCIAITEDEVSHFAAYGVAPQDVHIIPNGVDAEEYADSTPAAFRTKFSLGDHPFILFMGRLNSIKGPDLLLQAFCKLHHTFPEIHLVFAGPDGGMLESLRETALTCHVDDCVHFLGYVGGADKASAFRAATLLAIPSRQEAMSLVVLEAAIRETPVLLTDQCGFNIAAKHGGKVVSATVDGILQGLKEMLSAPADLKSSGELLGKFTRERYLWKSVVHTYVRLYEQLLSSPSR